MRIGIDARMMTPKATRGIGRYVEELVRAMLTAAPEHRYVLVTRTAIHPFSAHPSVETVVADVPWYGIAEQVRMPGVLRSMKADVVHVPHWNAPLRLKTPLAITIHDMILWEHPSLASTTLSPLKYWAKYFFYRFIVSQNVKRAKIVFTVSESAKNSILRNLKVSPEKIIVTPNGIDPLPYNPPPSVGEDVQPLFIKNRGWTGEGCPYILSVGSGYPHKNLPTFFKVAKELMTSNSQLMTIVAGTDPAFSKRLKKQAEEILGNDIDRIKFAGLVSDAELGKLYKNANALIFTSQVEGFGLPPLEAALAGTPVVASSIDTSREMLGSAVPLVNPTNVAGFVVAYRKIMANSAYKTAIISAAKAQAQIFSWDKTARLTQAGYKRIFSTR